MTKPELELVNSEEELDESVAIPEEPIHASKIRGLEDKGNSYWSSMTRNELKARNIRAPKTNKIYTNVKTGEIVITLAVGLQGTKSVRCAFNSALLDWGYAAFATDRPVSVRALNPKTWEVNNEWSIDHLYQQSLQLSPIKGEPGYGDYYFLNFMTGVLEGGPFMHF